MRPNRLVLLALSLSACSAETPLMQEAGPAIDPAISADGRWLAFASERGGSSFLHLWIRPFSGGAARQLTTGSYDDHEPAFSPDGRLLAYRSEGNGGGIYVIPVAGGKPRLFAPGGRRPRFSPDGRRIAFWTAAKSTAGLFVGDVSGGRARPLHAGFHSARDPVWSPDGKYLIFNGCRESSTEN